MSEYTKILSLLEKQQNTLLRLEKMLKSLSDKPALIKKAKTIIVKSSKKGPKQQLQSLVDEGFFKKQKSIPQILDELDKQSVHYKQSDLTRPLESFCQARILRREKKDKNNKKLWYYSNW